MNIITLSNACLYSPATELSPSLTGAMSHVKMDLYELPDLTCVMSGLLSPHHRYGDGGFSYQQRGREGEGDCDAGPRDGSLPGVPIARTLSRRPPAVNAG